MIKMVSGFALAVLLCAPTAAIAQSKRLPQPAHEAIYAVTKAWISAAAETAEARDLLAGSSDQSDGIAGLMSLMAANRKAVVKLNHARSTLPSPKSLAPDSTATTAVQAFDFVITSLIASFDRSLEIYKRLVTAKTDSDLANIMADTATTGAEIDDAWKLLPTATLMLSYAIIDTGRVTNGSLQHLRLTSAERMELAGSIVQSFPKASGGIKAGQHAVDAAMAALGQVLTGDHRSADEN